MRTKLVGKSLLILLLLQLLLLVPRPLESESVNGSGCTNKENALPWKSDVTVSGKTEHVSGQKQDSQGSVSRAETGDRTRFVNCTARRVEHLLERVRFEQDGLLRLEMLIENTIHEFGIDIFITYPQEVYGPLKLVFPYVHTYTVVSLFPNSSIEEYKLDGLFQVYKSQSNISAMLSYVRNHHKGPTIIAVNTENLKLSPEKVKQYTMAALSSATDRDIILLQGDLILSDLQRDLCKFHSNWEIYYHVQSRVYVLKSASLVRNMPSDPISPPDLVLSTVKPSCDPQHSKVDVILMTRNRPLQTYAYLESLRHYVSNINKVWVLYRADSDMFKEGYDQAFSCISHDLPIQGVQDFAGAFGLKLYDIVKESESQYLVLGVDEQIWLAPVDLQYAACLLKEGEGAFHSFQLRLGLNYGIQHFGRDKQFFPMKHNSDVYAYNPRFMKGDFGYLLNVDGVLVSKADFLEDVGHKLHEMKHPGYLESMWMYGKMHVRIKQWHLMYNHSRVVNNMYLKDGRMAQHDVDVKQEAYDNANKFVKEKKKIDVEQFVKENYYHSASHIKQPVTFIDLEC